MTIFQKILEYFLGDRDYSSYFNHIPTPFLLIVSGIACWVALTRNRRWDKYNAIHQKYGPKWDNGRGSITPEEAQGVIQLYTCYDMPLVSYYAVSFALFKTYAIPSISKLLISTKEFSSSASVSRRYADTDILITTWMSCPISGFKDPDFAATNRLDGQEKKAAEDPRAMIALARVNWLHAHYKISNEDYLYTLSLFIMQPAVWARKYGWRNLSPLEEHSFFVFWAEIGRRMNIQNIPDSLAELQAWSKQYETSYMMPAASNYETARHTLNELLVAVPKVLGMKDFAEKLAICLMEDIVRKSMMLPQQPWMYGTILNLVMKTVAIIQGWFLLPRRAPKFGVDTSIVTNSVPGVICPRLYPRRWASKPWYRREATSIGYYRDRLLVAIGWFAEMPGPHLKSTGYRIEEIGPVKFENSAHEEIIHQAAILQGCPIEGPWALPVNRQKKEA